MSAARERCTVSRFHKGFASTLTKARNRPPLLLPFYRVASYSQPRFHLKAWSLMDSDKRVSGTRVASKRVSTACSASRLTLTLRSMNRNFNHNIYYIYSILLNFVLNIVNVCQNVFFHLQMKDANSYAFVVMKEMGGITSRVDYSMQRFSRFSSNPFLLWLSTGTPIPSCI